jgi:hypothetical protein
VHRPVQWAAIVVRQLLILFTGCYSDPGPSPERGAIFPAPFLFRMA